MRLFRDVAAITMDFAGIESVNVRTLGSADTVTVNDVTGTDLKSANVDLGAFGGGGDGADTVTVNGTARADRLRVARSGSQVLTTGLAAQTTIDNSEESTTRGRSTRSTAATRSRSIRTQSC